MVSTGVTVPVKAHPHRRAEALSSVAVVAGGQGSMAQSPIGRLLRRRNQIRIVKDTRAYRAWSAFFAKHGRREDDPITPKADEATSKSFFENQLREWRQKLHKSPTA
ncbi:unnamed protein product [Symbiodinium natans]|uniref:Histone RNA hairpin-binding protein RNA-binding domain-containing protein n=1 Tax=Symbiodinium natans TaxID=878477 RepID=A0A812TI46_9DINO|nr:unnamed protein product [Symbiodinium natans]